MAQITLNSSGVASSGSLLLQTNGTTTQATVDTSGNMGLGVTPSAWRSTQKSLDIGVAASVTGFTALPYLRSYANAYINSGGSAIYKINGEAGAYTIDGNVHAWYNAASGTAGNAITFTQAMTLDSSGNLGIGTTSPSYPLDVVANASAWTGNLRGRSADNLGYLRFSSNNGSTTYAAIGTPAANTLGFDVNGAERARIDSSGNLLVGVTSGAGKLTVEGNGASNYTASFANTVTNNNVLLVSGTSSSNAQNYVVFAKAGTVTGTIYFNGSTVAYNTTSDYRLKEDVAPVNGSLARIASLNPIEFTWRNNGIRSRGFLAHNFQEVYPQSVNGAKDAIDEKGKPVYQTMQASTSEVIADLVACIQEQQAIIETLTNRITALEQA